MYYSIYEHPVNDVNLKFRHTRNLFLFIYNFTCQNAE